MDTFEINQEQLALLRDPKNMPLLQLLMEPHTPSEAAKHFGLSNNALHYRFKKLSDANLIQEVGQRGNRRKYQVVARHFRINRKLVEGVEVVIPKLQEEQLQLVSKHFLDYSETYFRTVSQDDDKPYLHFYLRTRMKPTPYKPVFMARELRLSDEDYCQLTELIQNFLAKARVNNEKNLKLKNCTVTFMMCEGGAISGKSVMTDNAKPQRSSLAARSSANKQPRLASKHRA